MGTKRAFNEDLQEFIDHPNNFNYGNKPDSFPDGHKHFRTDNSPESENVVTVPYMLNHKEFETTQLPLVTGIGTDDSDSESVPVFHSNLFSEFLENNFPSRKLICFNDVYSTLLNCPPRKVIPIGPNHQADIPEFNPEVAKTYKNKSGMENFLGVCVVGNGIGNSDGISHSDGIRDSDSGCECFDGGSVRCVQQHVKESRLKLMESIGCEKFVNLGMMEMGEEVGSKWSEKEERIFHEVVYSNTGSIGNMLWKQLLGVFPSRRMKELVSYYFNVFILRRRAVQNRSRFLDIDSDDDEWRESYSGCFGEEDDDFVVGGCFGNHEDGGAGGSYGGEV